MPGFTRDLRKRATQPYSGPNPIQARWRHPEDPRVRRERSFATKREALAWIAEQDTDAKRGVWSDPHRGRESVEALVELWQEATRHQIGPKTRQGYQAILNQHILPTFGPRRVAGIDAAAIQAWANELADRRSLKTVKNTLMVLKSILDFAVLRGYIVVNPCSSVRLSPAKRERKITPLPHADLFRLADAMPTPRDRAAVLVAGYCGLRAGEVWALRRNDVMLRRLRVDESITEADVASRDADYTVLDNGLAIGPTKTFNDEPVAMPEFVAEALALLITADMPTDAFLFTDSDGGPMRQTNWYLRTFTPTARAVFPDLTRQAEERAQARARRSGRTLTDKQLSKVSPLRFHDLRHTCAAYLIEHGFHPKVIQLQMRHSSIKTTMDVYGHLFEDGLDAVADALDAGYRERTGNRTPINLAR